jgi:hypothetical protein
MSKATEKRTTMLAITSGVAAVRGAGDVLFHEGEIYAADHPLVKQCPQFFVPSDSTTQEVRDAKVRTGNYRG